MVYLRYKNEVTECFEIIVEDAADEFQKVQDVVNC